VGDTSLMIMIKRREYEALKRSVGSGAENPISDLLQRIESSFSLPRQERERLCKAAKIMCTDDRVSFDDHPSVEEGGWVNCWIQIPEEHDNA
jgi:hypothetical protein